MTFNRILLALFLCFNCSTWSQAPTNDLIESFESSLNNLNKQDITSLDEALRLFKDAIIKSENIQQRDSLFMPYFNYYNIGRTLLIDQDSKVIESYGFKKNEEKGKMFLVPIESLYLKNNVIAHLSEPMQKFCIQNLKEFDSIETYETLAQKTLWWEMFNKEHPDFFLKEMTIYHYKNWHLKNLLSGTNRIKVFTEKGSLLETVLKVYLRVIQNHPKTDTAKTLNTYLGVLKRNNMKKTEDVTNFLKQFN